MENQYFKVAEVLSPLTDDLTNSCLQDTDPVLFNLMKYFAGVIQLHIGDRFTSEVIAAGLIDLAGKSIAQVISYDPLPISTEDQYKFPLLAVYRTEEEYEYKTISWYSIKSEIQVLYILPPVTSDQGKRLYPLTTHVARTLVDRTAEGFDENFNSGQKVWATAGLDQIGVSSAQYGKFPGLKQKETSNIWFPGVSLIINCQERRMFDSRNFVNFQGFDGYVEAYDPETDGHAFEVDIKKDF